MKSLRIVLKMTLSWMRIGFYDYYESNGWRVGKTPMKDWQAAIRNWVRNEQTKYPLLPSKPEIDADKYKREDE